MAAWSVGRPAVHYWIEFNGSPALLLLGIGAALQPPYQEADQQRMA